MTFLKWKRDQLLNDLPKHVARFYDIVGDDKIERWASHFARKFCNGHLAVQLAKERFPIECGLVYVLCLNANTKLQEILDCLQDPYNERAANFLVSVSCVWPLLPVNGRKKLRGEIIKGLKDRNRGLLPLCLEFQTATNLIHRGFAVEFCDLESLASHDLNVRSGDLEFAVEVKTVFPFHPDLQISEVVRIYDIFERFVKDADVTDDCFKHYEIALEKGSNTEARLRTVEDFFITKNGSNCDNSIGSLQLSTICTQGSDREGIVNELKQLVDRTSYSAFILRPNGSGTGISVSIRNEGDIDMIVNRLKKTLSKAAAQISQVQKPSIVVLGFGQLTEENLVELSRRSSTSTRVLEDIFASYFARKTCCAAIIVVSQQWYDPLGSRNSKRREVRILPYFNEKHPQKSAVEDLIGTD